MRIWRTLRSLAFLSKAFAVSTNLSSRFRVKVWPGLSVRMRTSMMALYCHEGRDEYSLPMYLRMMRAHSAAAAGDDSAASTMGGRKSTSSLWALPPDSQKAFCSGRRLLATRFPYLGIAMTRVPWHREHVPRCYER